MQRAYILIYIYRRIYSLYVMSIYINEYIRRFINFNNNFLLSLSVRPSRFGCCGSVRHGTMALSWSRPLLRFPTILRRPSFPGISLWWLWRLSSPWIQLQLWSLQSCLSLLLEEIDLSVKDIQRKGKIPVVILTVICVPFFTIRIHI